MRFLKFLIIFFLFLVSCKTEVFNNSNPILNTSKISNCDDIINQLESCLEIHKGALGYLDQNCSVETLNFVKENVNSCESLIDYFIVK